MKRIICAFLAACALLLTACAPTAAAPEATTAPEITAAPEVTAPPETEPTPEPPSTVPDQQLETVSVTIDTQAQDYYDEDHPETMIFSFSADLPQVTIPGADRAAAAVNAALHSDYDLFVNGDPNAPEGVVTGADTFLSRAREDLQYWTDSGNPDYFVYFILTRRAAMTRGDSRVVSFTYEDTTGLGGVHPYTAMQGRSFDARTGERLTLSGLAEDPEGFLAALEEKLIEMSQDADHAGYMYFEEPAQSVPRLLEGDNWYFNDQGLVIFANPEDLAPYADGRIDFQLSYDWLAPWIGADYFPG